MTRQFRGVYTNDEPQDVLGNQAVLLVDSKKGLVNHTECQSTLKRRGLQNYFLYIHCPEARKYGLALLVHLEITEEFNKFLFMCEFANFWNYTIWAVPPEVHQAMGLLPE